MKDAIHKWKSFKDNKSTYKTVFAVAKSAGWKNPRRSTARGEEELESLLQHCIYVQAGDQVADLRKPAHNCQCTITEFRNRYANYRVFAEDSKTVPVTTLWFQDKSRKTAEGAVFEPSQDRTFKDKKGFDWLNTYEPPEFKPTNDTNKLMPFKDHMEYLIPRKEERDWFVSWMAFNVQNPGTRCKVTPLHVSVPHGVGRGWVVDLLGLLVGYLKKTTMKNLIELAFNNYMHESLIVAIEEVKESTKRYSAADKLRGLLTEDLQVSIPVENSPIVPIENSPPWGLITSL